MIVSAVLSDANKLTEIAITSKTFWGYSKELIESWQTELTVTSKIITDCFVYKFIVDKTIVGFYVLNQPNKDAIELEMLFVLPKFIGEGIGKKLLHHSFEKAIHLTAKSMTLLADPNAVYFYVSQGFYEIVKKESSIAGRFLPVMKKDLVQ